VVLIFLPSASSKTAMSFFSGLLERLMTTDAGSVKRPSAAKLFPYHHPQNVGFYLQHA